MPKPLITRAILGVAFVAAATLGIASAWQTRSGDDAAAAHSVHAGPRDIARRQDELRFLKAAFDRLEAEAKQNPNSPALRSLRTEQEAVLLRMREVARPVPRDRLPEEFRALLGNGPPEMTAAPVEKPVKEAPQPVSPPPVVTAGRAAIGAPHPGDLKPGLAAGSPPPDLVLSRDPGLSNVVVIARPRRPRPAAEAPGEKPGEQPPANANASATADTKPPANANASATAETKPPPKPQVTVRAPERAAPVVVSGAVERPAAGPVAILGR